MRASNSAREIVERSFVTMQSPVGTLTLVATRAGLSELWFDTSAAREAQRSIGRTSPRDPVLLESARQLREYFGGKRTRFEIPLDISGTDFQRRAWLALLDIPFGETRSYAEHASRIGHPRAHRLRRRSSRESVATRVRTERSRFACSVTPRAKFRLDSPLL